MRSKEILCDSGIFISLTDSCLDPILRFFTEKHGVHFIIPPSVEYEIVKRPLKKKMKQYSFSAIKLKELISDGVILSVDANVEYEAKHIQRVANNLFFAKGKSLNLIQMGEAEMIALAKRLDIENILIDERTTRLLIEAPYKMKSHLAEELGVNVMVDKKSLTEFSSITKGMSAIRSCELVMVAYENGYFDHFKELKLDVLEAALYKVKFSGCSLRFDEVRDYMKIARS
jgi:predicted nucleic acid-binding protein